MLKVELISDRPFCNRVQQLAQFVSPVPDPQAWAVDTLSLPWEGLDPYALSPAVILGKVVKLQDYLCRRIILIAPGWPNWDLVLQPDSTVPAQPAHSTIQTPHRNLSNLNLHAWLLQPQQSRSRASLRQWEHELRLLKEDQSYQSMRQSGSFLQSGASVIRRTSGHPL